MNVPVRAAIAPVDHDPFAGFDLARAVPTTESQREVWLADQYSPEASLAYNESISLNLRGVLDITALQRSLDALVMRHEALRASIEPGGKQLHIAAAGSLPIVLIDVSELSTVAQAQRLETERARAVETPFALDTGPLIRATLIRRAALDHVLLLTAHHIVCDGWSFAVLIGDLAAIYSAESSGNIATPPAAAQFGDYAIDESRAQAAGTPDADERYWVSQFEHPAPALELPADRGRPAVRAYSSLREDSTLEVELVAQLKRFAARNGSTLFGVLMAGFAALMARLSAQAEVVVGVPSAGQSSTDAPSLVGHCVNLLPLRLSTDQNQTGPQLIRATQQALFDAFEHRRCTFGTLIRKLQMERDPSRPPLVSVNPVSG